MNTKKRTVEKSNSQQGQQSQEEKLTKEAFGKIGADERSKLLQTRQPIEGTPFTKGWIEGHGWAIGLDNKRLTEWVETEEQIDEKIKKGGLTLKEVTTLIYILIADVKEQEEFMKQN